MLITKVKEAEADVYNVRVSIEEMEVIQLALLEYRDRHIKLIEQYRKEDLLCGDMFNVIDIKLEAIEAGKWKGE